MNRKTFALFGALFMEVKRQRIAMERIADFLERITIETAAGAPEESDGAIPDDFPAANALREKGITKWADLPRTMKRMKALGFSPEAAAVILRTLQALSGQTQKRREAKMEIGV